MNGSSKEHDESSRGLSARASYSLRLAAFYGAMFLVLGIHLPYLPVWLDMRGLSAQEIAAVTAAPLFMRVFITPAAAMLADRTGYHRAMVNGLAWLALLFALLLSQMHGFWPIFLVAVPFAILLSTMMPLTETMAVAGVRAHGLDYGRMRLWGSITFVAAGSIGGWLIDEAGAGVVMGCIAGGLLATVTLAWMLPERARSEPPAPCGEGLETGATPTANGSKPTPSSLARKRRGAVSTEALKLVRSPVFLAFLLAVGAVQGAHGMFYAFGALAWQAQGLSTAWIGTLWAIAIAGEVALFAYSGRVVRRWGPGTLMVGAGVAAVVRWTMMAFSPPLSALILLQTLHTLTYGASHLSAMHFISRAVPESAQGTAQALYATVAMGILIGGATLVSGWLYARIGAEAYLAMAVLAATGLAAALFVRARWTGGPLWHSEADARLA